MFKADVYRITIHSLGVILEEEHLAKITIDKWNEEHSEKRGKLFLQVPCNSITPPDINVVIIDSYIDTATVDKIITTDKQVALFFNKYHNPKNSMQSELDAIEAYCKVVNDKCICYDYENTLVFSNAIMEVLNRI